MRSLLLVSLDDPAALDRAMLSGADALVFDVAGQAAPTDTTFSLIRNFLLAAHEEIERPLLFVRIAGLDRSTVDSELGAIMAGSPDGLLLARSASVLDVQQLGAKLAVQEARSGIGEGETAIIAETGLATLFAPNGYRGLSDRVLGLTWDAQTSADELGATLAVEIAPSSPLLLVRNATLLGARMAGVSAIDGARPDLLPGQFRTECEQARADGFNAKTAVSAEQVHIVNEVFDRGAE